jgi:DoxX-like family
MQFIAGIAQAISIASFVWYGMSCFVSAAMVAEFERYRLARFRSLTGMLQVAGSLGLFAGYFSRPLLLLSAGGLAAMMLLGVLVRLRIRDPLVAAIPAFAFFALNLFIVAAAL